ncbi:protein FAM161A-like [Branchiostoma floridae x Branchiostoma belcheri]
MATGHGMAVLTNSCVKNPRMPGSRLAASFSERLDTTKIRKGRQGQKRSPGRRTESVDEFLRSDDDEEPRNAATAPQEVWLKPEERESQAAGDYDYTGEHGDIERTVDPIGDLANEMSNMSTDDFYEKMQELKREHQKTLSMVHGLYEEIREAEDRRSHREQNGGASMDSEDTEELFRDLDDLRSSFRASRSADKIRDMTAAKPPLPTTSSRPPSVSSSKFAWSGKRDQDIDLNYLKRARSLSEQDLRRVGSDSYASSDDDFELDGRTSPWRQTTPGPTPMSRIDNMWDDFSVEDYAPRGRSVSRASRTSVSTKKSKEWSPKITIPEPFEMTLREASKPKKKTSAMLALQEHLITKQQREEAELQKKFKASPAPAHVYVPMFDDIMREQEEKRQQIRQYSKEILKSMEKPFSFYKREEEKKKERLEKAQFMMKTSPKKKKVKQFKAKPVPKSLHDPAAADRILEDEEYRAIKKKMRAEELMRSASLPPSMQARENAKKADSYNRFLYSKRPKSAGYSFKPKIRHSVPDFDQIHKKLQWELGQKRRAKEATVAEPFNLRTSRIPSNTHKIYEDIERDQQSLKENRWPFKAPRSRPLSSPGRLSTSMDSIPAATTESTRKRTAAVRASLMEREMEEQEWRMREKQKRQKEKEIRKSLAAKARANDQSLALSEVNDDKLKEFRDQERARQLDYKRSLNEMMARVESRPYMFERQSQINARKAAEKKYQEALRNAGVDEDFVAERNSRSRPTSYHVSDSDSDEGSYQNTTGASRDRSPSASEESDLEV